MNSKDQKIFIGVAWPYVNGDLHIGHLAGCLIPCDIFARFSRLKGFDTLMVSGTDCHGTPITVAADKKNVSPREIVEEYDPKVREILQEYNISFDLFTSTLTENHKKVTQEFFLNLLRNGYILKKYSKQYYSTEDQKFLPDRYVEGECPHCHAKDQRSDQCEQCGRTLAFGELINPKSKLSGSEVGFKETEHYFINYPKLQEEIERYISKSEGWRNWVRKESEGWIKEGLEVRAITRDIDWGVEIPAEEIKKIDEKLLLENYENKRFYVWFDAVIGYFSAAVEWAERNNRDFLEFWKNKNTKHYYFLGKDNLTFHTIFWPGQIIGQEKDYNLPFLPSVNQFLNLEGEKLSKSRGHYIGAQEILEKYGADRVRFYISSILPEEKDAKWKWEDFKSTINNELVGNIGNFIHRTLIFYKNKLESKLSNDLLDKNVEEEIKSTFNEVDKCLTENQFVKALNRILQLSKFGNQYFDQKKPWVSLKENREECEKAIYNCLQIVNSLRILLTPYIPDAMNKLSDNLGILQIASITSASTNSKFEFSLLNLDESNLVDDLKPLFEKVEEI